MTDKTATERLRDGLTASGVEWWPMHDDDGEYHEGRDTEFVIDGRKHTAHEWGNGLTVWGLTPEQAIAATVGEDISGQCPNSNRTCPDDNETCPNAPTSADDVIRDIDQLRRDLTGYHGQLVAHNNLQRHCDNQRRRIGELEGLYADAKAESARLRELVKALDWCTENFDSPDRCDNCPLPQSDGLTPECELRMRDLGIEVDA